MTEAPGRKNDAHLSSVPGDEGRAAKIGEVFFYRLRIISNATFVKEAMCFFAI